jgi:hypothetical protein
MIDKTANCKTRFYITVKNESAENILVRFADSAKADYGFKVNLTIYKNDLLIGFGQSETDSVDFAWEQADACSYMSRTSIAYRVKVKAFKNDSTEIYNDFLFPYDTLKANDHNYDYHICDNCLNKAYDTIIIK